MIDETTDHPDLACWHLGRAQGTEDELEFARDVHALLAAGHALMGIYQQLDDIATYLTPTNRNQS